MSGPRSPELARSRAPNRPRLRARWPRRSCSSTVSGCTPTRGARGSTASGRRATRRSRRAGPVTRPRWRKPGSNPTAWRATASTTWWRTTPDVIRQLDAKPIVIGHSFGGLIVQRLLGDDLAAAAVAIDPAPIKGVLILPLSALRVASVALLEPAEQEARGRVDRRAVPLRLRERDLRRRVRRAVRALDDPVAGAAAVRGRIRQFLTAVAREGQHGQRIARPAAAHRRAARITRSRPRSRRRRSSCTASHPR